MLSSQRRLGETHPHVVNTQKGQSRHLLSLIKSSTVDVSDARALMTRVADDTSGALTPAQLTELSEALCDVMSGDGREVMEVGPVGSKSQAHMFSYNYYSDAEWTNFGDRTKPIRQKMNTMSKNWLMVGCRWPSEPTFRVGLATLAVAGALQFDANQARDKLTEFKDVFRSQRNEHRGEATMKKFFENVDDYVRLYPTVYGEASPPVRCPHDVSEIKVMADKRSIPCRDSNRTARPKHGHTQAQSGSASSTGSPTDQFLQGLVRFALQGVPDRMQSVMAILRATTH